MVKFFDKAKVDFIVKEDEGVVIAKFSNPVNVTDTFLNHIESNSWDAFKNMYNRVSTVRGVAKCAPEDKFDVKIGKRIALNHLKTKTAHSFVRFIIKLAQDKIKEYNTLVDFSISGGVYIQELEQQLRKTYEMVETK